MPLNIDWQQILLHLFNFALLFTILYVLLYKPVKKFMDQRSNYYKELDEKAHKSVEESAAVQSMYEQRLEKANEEIDELRAKASEEAGEIREKIIAEAKEESAHIIESAKTAAIREREHILDSAGDEISKMVTEATAKIVFSDGDNAYEQFLNAVEGSEHDE